MEGGPGNPRAYVAAAAAALLLASCGGDSDDKGDDDARYSVEIVRAEFPRLQRLAQQSMLELAVRNTGDEAIPNLAVTVNGLAERSQEVPQLTLWIIDAPPRGAVTASADTWTAGRVASGATATLRWRLTPVEPGRKTLSYAVAGGLEGDVGAALANGSAARGKIAVRVTDRASKARVDPRTGAVVRE